jgi:hypothetical protein
LKTDFFIVSKSVNKIQNPAETKGAHKIRNKKPQLHKTQAAEHTTGVWGCPPNTPQHKPQATIILFANVTWGYGGKVPIIIRRSGVYASRSKFAEKNPIFREKICNLHFSSVAIGCAQKNASQPFSAENGGNSKGVV